MAARKRILVVEDVVLIRMTTVDMLNDLGHETLEAGSGPEALDILRANPDVDVLFTDLGLPGMSGGALANQVRALRPDIKIVIASGYATAPRAGEEPPPDALRLSKPFDLGQLRRLMQTL